MMRNGNFYKVENLIVRDNENCLKTIKKNIKITKNHLHKIDIQKIPIYLESNISNI
jgi:hypothetical protein